MWLPFFPTFLHFTRQTRLRSQASGDPFAHNHRWAVDGDFALPESSGGKIFVHQQKPQQKLLLFWGAEILYPSAGSLESR